MNPTMDQRLTRLEKLRASGRIIRGAWTGSDDDGRETACLLAALSPEAAAVKRAADCPACVMPEWMAHLTVWINDAPSLAGRPGIVARYAGLAHRWSALDDAAWGRLDHACRRIAVVEARTHTDDPSARAAIDGVITLIDRQSAGDIPTIDEWREGGAVALAAELKAILAGAAQGARAAATAARSARVAVTSKAPAVKSSGAIWAMWAARSARTAASMSAKAGWESVADRMIHAMLDAIEAEIVKAEGAA